MRPSGRTYSETYFASHIRLKARRVLLSCSEVCTFQSSSVECGQAVSAFIAAVYSPLAAAAAAAAAGCSIGGAAEAVEAVEAATACHLDAAQEEAAACQSGAAEEEEAMS